MKCRRTNAYGGPGGGTFEDNLTQAASMAGFVVDYGSWVFGLCGIYRDAKGNPLPMKWHGGQEGQRDIVRFDKDEYITRVQGQTAKFDHGTCVSQLTFMTNKGKKHGPYGAVGGEKWEVQKSKPDSQLVGFFGRSGTLIDQVGFFELIDATVWIPTQTYGGHGSKSFTTDLTEVDRLTGVTVRHGGVIDAIQATFRKTDGTEFITERFGGPGGESHEFRLDNNEHLAWVKGEFGPYDNTICITQLRFDKARTFGPYGAGGGTEFKPFGDETKIGGFLGQYDPEHYLNQIGFFVLATHVVTDRPITREEVEAMIPKAKKATPALAGANK